MSARGHLQLAAVVAAVATLPLIGCSGTGSSSTSSSTPEQRLAQLDGDKAPVSTYAHLLDKLEPQCTQDRERIAAEAYAMYQVAHQHGVTNTTYLDQLKGLQIAVAAQPAAGKVNCLQFAAAVTTLEPAQGK